MRLALSDAVFEKEVGNLNYRITTLDQPLVTDIYLQSNFHPSACTIVQCAVVNLWDCYFCLYYCLRLCLSRAPPPSVKVSPRCAYAMQAQCCTVNDIRMSFPFYGASKACFIVSFFSDLLTYFCLNLVNVSFPR